MGILAKACEARTACVAELATLFNMALTLATAWMIFSVLRWTGRASILSFSVACAFTILPSVVFYENYPFYPHLTMMLFAGCGFFGQVHQRSGSVPALVCLLACLAGLSWTWSLYHPLIVLGIGLAVWTLSGRTRREWVTFAVFVAVVASPAVKNAWLFGFWGTGSWLGFNLTQVDPSPVPSCDFMTVLAAAPPEIPPSVVLNDAAIPARSQACAGLALAGIADQPLTYAKGRVRQALLTLSVWPTDYFNPPIGFEAYPSWESGAPMRDSEGRRAWGATLARVVAGVSNVVALSVLLASPLLARTGPTRRALVAPSLLAATLLLLGYALNGGEQERMRYTLQAGLYLATLWTLFRAAQVLNGWRG